MLNEKVLPDFSNLTGVEDVSLRTANTKHFALNGKQRQAVTYDAPVHFSGPDGKELLEIDNNLVLEKDTLYTNRANDLRISFPISTSEDFLVRVEYQGHHLAWKFDRQNAGIPGAVLSGKEIKKAQIVNYLKARGEEYPKGADVDDVEHRLFTPEEIRLNRVDYSSEINYREILPGINVSCLLFGKTIKEDITALSPDVLNNLSIVINSNCTLRLQRDNSICAIDRETGESVFRLAMPVVRDNSREPLTSYPRIDLTEEGDMYRLRYTLDDTFLARATFPITIDPTVLTEHEPSSLQDSYIRSDMTGTNFGTDTVMVAGVYNTAESVGLIRFQELVAQSASDTLISAQLRLSPRSEYASSSYVLAAYEILGDWAQSSVTWTNMQPNNTARISPNVLSYIVGTNSTHVYFTLTDQYRSWYHKSESGVSHNFGIAIRRPANLTNRNYAEFRTLESGANGTYGELGPRMVVNYLSHAGISSWRTYETMSAGRAGTVSVDLYNGNLIYAHPDVASTGSRMPVAVTHYYNSCKSTTNNNFCGYGWRMSVQQSLTRKTLNSTINYVWTQGDGSEHYLVVPSGSEFSDEEGLGLKLSISGSTATITDKGDNKLVFPLPSYEGATTWLSSAKDAVGNECKYTYDTSRPDRITKITDPAERETKFTYYSFGMLETITAPDGRSVKFHYGDWRIIRIEYSDLTTSQYTSFSYDNDTHLLTKVTNYDGVNLNATYESDIDEAWVALVGEDYDILSRRVISLITNGTGMNGARRDMEYLPQTTVVTDVETDGASTNKKLTYIFNDAGNVVSVYDELGYGQFAEFASSIPNTPSAASRLQKAVINLARGLAFDSSLWTTTKGYSSDAVSVDTSTRCLSLPSGKLVKKGAGETTVAQTDTVYTTGSHTFSAYIKTTGLTGGYAFIRIKVGSTAYESLKIQESTVSASGGPAAEGWERVQVTANVPSGTTSVTIQMVCTASSGTVYYACPQLEVGDIANHVNLLTNASFTRTVTNSSRLFPADWTASSGISTSELNCVVTSGHGLPDGVTGNALQMTSAPKVDSVAFSQSIPVRGSSGDVFVIGGWANTLSVASGAEHSAPCIAYRFVGSSTGSWQYAEFSRKHVGWHFGCWAIVADRTYTSIEYTINYARNTQTGMFSNVFCYREQFGESFAYDSNHNVTSVENLSKTKASAAYDTYNNLTSYVQPGAASTAKYTFDYGSTTAAKKQHLLLSETTPKGTKNTYTYDTYGNRLSAINKKSGGTNFIKTSSTYDATGNYEVSSTDSRGNTANRTLNDDYTVQKVTDTTGQAVDYTYDSSKRVTSASTKVGTYTYQNAYTYENDRIKTVAHNTTGSDNNVKYTFDYNNLGQKTTVKVGTQTLSTNLYGNTRAHRLYETDYGDGGKVRYYYDTFNRLEHMRYDEETFFHFTYSYGANGQVAVIKDNALNRIQQSEYDLAERPIQSTLRDTGGNTLYRATLHYDGQNRLDTLKETVGNGSTTYAYQTAYTYDTDNRTTQVDFGSSGSQKINYTYDDLARISTRKATNSSTYTTTYSYLAGGQGTNSTTPLVSAISQGSGTNAMDFNYTYDDRGFIIEEERNQKKTSYTYDAIGQLIRVDDENDTTSGSDGTTWVFTYDRGGNILSKKGYVYTTGTPSQIKESISYTYGNSNWKDLLTAYNGITLTNTAIGSLAYDGTWTYTWKAGRQLQKMVRSGMTVEYAYDHNGLRTQKKVTVGSTTTTTEYRLHGKMLMQLCQGSNRLHFYYDANSRPAMVEYNGTMYTYVHNLQGDIVAIVNNNGTVVVEYFYDAWGKLLKTTGTMASTLGLVNPFRYRGYVYDEETGLYYLRSRYYNSTWCRFICADAIICDMDLGLNLFTYCSNKPIDNYDSDGLTNIYYFIHFEVQKEIQKQFANHGLNARLEARVDNVQYRTITDLTYTGRIDILIEQTGEVYEVKKATLSLPLAVNQVNRYIAGNVGESYTKEGLKVGSRRSFLNYNTFELDSLYIEYWYAENGVIMYIVYNNSGDVPQLAPVPSLSAQRRLANNRELIQKTSYSGSGGISASSRSNGIMFTPGLAGVAVGALVVGGAYALHSISYLN